MRSHVPLWVLSIVSVVIILMSGYSFFLIRKHKNMLWKEIENLGRVNLELNDENSYLLEREHLYDCDIPCDELNRLYEAAVRDSRAWKEQAANCVHETIRVRAN